MLNLNNFQLLMNFNQLLDDWTKLNNFIPHIEMKNTNLIIRLTPKSILRLKVLLQRRKFEKPSSV